MLTLVQYAGVKNSHDVLDFLASVVDRFLKRHGFLASTTERAASKSPTKHPHAKKKQKINEYSEDQADEGFQSRQARQRSVFFEKQESNAIYVYEPDQEQNKEEISWTDATSGRTFLVDPRTGNSYLKSSRQGDGSGHRHNTSGRRTLSQARHSCTEDDTGAVPDWIEDALRVNAKSMHPC